MQVKFEFGPGRWFLTELFPLKLEINKTSSGSALKQLKGCIYKAEIAYYTNILPENSGQVWIYFRADDFWQPLVLKNNFKKSQLPFITSATNVQFSFNKVNYMYV